VTDDSHDGRSGDTDREETQQGGDDSPQSDEAFRRHWEELRDGHRPPEAGQTARSGLFGRLRHAQSGPLLWLRIGLVILTGTVLLGGVLFALAGTWPVVVGIESGSMEPNIAEGDMVVLTAPDRFPPAAAESGLGVVTYRAGKARNYRSFGSYGSVVVFRKPDGNGAIIHRVHFRVVAGENWIDRANRSHLEGRDCEEIEYCPAPHDGFITKGDANPHYDQATGLVPPVRADWVVGVGRFRLPTG
jgi:signal peptidase